MPTPLVKTPKRTLPPQAGCRDLLLALVSYPDRLGSTAIGNAAALAARLGGEVTALALHVDIHLPRNPLANLLMNMQELVQTEEARSAGNAQALVRAFETAAHAVGAPTVIRTEKVELYGEAERFALRARTHDLTMLPMGSDTLNDRPIAEALLFQSGRPVLLVPDTAPLGDEGRVHTVAVAWDGSRQAARALADAMPLLVSADQVRVLTIVNEKPSAATGAGADVARHLALHGVRAAVDEIDAGGEPIGRVLKAYIAANFVDLLVMGAFGRSRAREFVLGGATRSVLDDVAIPVLMSH